MSGAKIQIPVSWLVTRANIELIKINHKQVSIFRSLFMSKKKQEERVRYCAECLGRIRMIEELMEKFDPTKDITQIPSKTS